MSGDWAGFPGQLGLTRHELVVSGFGEETGGGLYRLVKGGFAQIDALSSTGLAVRHDRVARFLRAPGDQTSTGELMVYDATGLLSYHRLDGVPDAHDATYDGDLLVVASSASNSILWLDASGAVVRRWSPDPSAGDAWHVNGLALRDGALVFSAFGRFSRHREWAGDKQLGAGFVTALDGDLTVAEGLTCPHSPRLHEEGWYVCESHARRLLLLPRDGGTALRSVTLDGWTRGIDVTDGYVFVGESAGRGPAGSRRATVAILDRRSLEVVDRVVLPCAEVFDIAVVPTALAQGLVTGAATNSHRLVEQLLGSGGQATIRFTGNPLPLGEAALDISADLPDAARSGGQLPLSVRLSNRSALHYASVPPYPVLVVARWYAPSGELLAEPRFRLPSELRPEGSVEVPAPLTVPEITGTLRLSVTLVQEHVGWFDDFGLVPLEGWVEVS
jgi:hypothetical protein